MNENLVRWTLMNNPEYLKKALNFDIACGRGQEITTDFGRIDFIVEGYKGEQWIVELETILNTESKLEYCFKQVRNYKNVKFTDNTSYCILYAIETPNEKKSKIEEFSILNDVLRRTYSMHEVRSLYAQTLKRLGQSFGLALPAPKTYTICYLRWLNKILKPFFDFKKDILNPQELAKYFTSSNTTNFRCYLRLALDFEMIELKESNYLITRNGERYINNFNPIILKSTKKQLPSIDLLNEQRRLLLTILTNGKWTVHKVNIYWFLRFVEVTDGQWIPNSKNFEEDKLELVNGLFGVTYKKRTVYELLNFSCNFCIELGLVERIKLGGKYDKIYLTPLGVEVSNIFSLDLLAKRSRLNLNFKYLE